MIFGYARISTNSQNIERQVRNIVKDYPDVKIYKEAFTGKVLARPEFDRLLARVKAGDTIVFDSVSRMSRNAEEGFKLYKELYEKGVNLVFLKEHHIDTDTYKKELDRQLPEVSTGNADADMLVKGIIDALNTYILNLAEKQIRLAFEQSQKEVDDLRQRTREGLETARRNGKQIGGHKTGVHLKIKKKKPVQELILKHSRDFNGTLKDAEVMALINATKGLHVASNTYYKYKKELRVSFFVTPLTA